MGEDTAANGGSIIHTGQGMGAATGFTWVKPAMMMKMTTATCTTVMTAHGSTGRSAGLR